MRITPLLRVAPVLAAALSTLPVLAQTTTGSTSTGSATSAAPLSMPAPPAPAASTVQQKLADNFDRLFLLKAAQGNMAEVMTAQLALRQSRNPQVLQLAQMLIREHGQANMELMPILRAKGLPMPRFIGAMNAATYDQISKLKRERFDQMFMAAQVEAHEAAITLYQQELALGKDDDARAYATKYLPGILNHSAVIYGVAGMVKAPGSAERMVALRSNMAEMTALMQTAMSGMNMGNTGQMNMGTANSGTTNSGTR